MTGYQIGKLPHAHAEQTLEPLAREHGADVPVRDPFALPQEVGAVGSAQRVVRIVGGEEDAVTRAGERADFAHDLALVAEVEVRGRFVEHDELRLLRKRARHARAGARRRKSSYRGGAQDARCRIARAPAPPPSGRAPTAG